MFWGVLFSVLKVLLCGFNKHLPSKFSGQGSLLQEIWQVSSHAMDTSIVTGYSSGSMEYVIHISRDFCVLFITHMQSIFLCWHSSLQQPHNQEVFFSVMVAAYVHSADQGVVVALTAAEGMRQLVLALEWLALHGLNLWKTVDYK